jgi:hypothetical protein
MGYKTKSMIYAKSLKETNDEAAAKAAAIKPVNIEDEGEKEENNKKDENKKDGTYNDGTRTTITVGNESEYTGGNEGVSAGSNTYTSSGQNLGVLSGLASGSTGTRIGTALGILTNKSMKLMAKRKAVRAKKEESFNKANPISTTLPKKQKTTTSMRQITSQKEIKI